MGTNFVLRSAVILISALFNPLTADLVDYGGELLTKTVISDKNKQKSFTPPNNDLNGYMRDTGAVRTQYRVNETP